MSKHKVSKDGGNKDAEQSAKVVTTFYAVVIILVCSLLGWFVYASTVNPESNYPFRLGLDLAGGSHLVYEADTSSTDPSAVPELMSVLRDVIEKRVNIFGVSEPIVQVESSSFVSGVTVERLVVELPGVTDVDEAVAEIGRTPLLEFKLFDEELANAEPVIKESEIETVDMGDGTQMNQMTLSNESPSPYVDTDLTGRYLENARLVFNQGYGVSNEPIVQIQFNSEGAELFEQITRDNVGTPLAIFLDDEVVSAPVINEAISGGTAVISGSFGIEEAKALVENLNFGALPIAIKLASTQTIGASLGEEVLGKGVMAGAIGLIMVGLFMLVWYRLTGLVAVLALGTYIVTMLTLFKLIPVTLTAAGLAGFILSVGMAVDANVLVFERMKEEYRGGKNSRLAIKDGFRRAWTAIRDGNLTSIISAIILFWLGSSVVKGFALVFGLGVLLSMITTLLVTRTILLALPDVPADERGLLARLYYSGLSKPEN